MTTFAILVLLAILGFILSVYGNYIEKKSSLSKKYKAFCDVNERVSCSKAFSSSFGKQFGISNTIWGMIFYALVVILAFLGAFNLVFYLSVVSLIGSAYLAYVLYFKLKNFCMICNIIYVVNILLFVLSYGLL